MNPKNKYLALVGVVAVVVVGWFVLAHVATNRAEEAITSFLDEHGLRQSVQWESLSASPFGNVKIKNISVKVGPNAEALHIARLQLKDFTDTPDRKSIDLRLSDVSDAQGYSPLRHLDFVQAGGRANLPPFSVQVKWDMRVDDDEGKAELSFNQPDSMQGGLEFEVDKISALANLGQSLLTGSLGGIAQRGTSSRNPLLSGAQGALSTLGEVRVKRLKANVKDEGHMVRSIALYKRYSMKLSPSDSNPRKARDNAFEKETKTELKKCQDAASTDTLKRVPRVKKSCEAVVAFVRGDSRNLKLSAEPAQPVSLTALFQAGMSSPERTIVLMSPVFD